MSRSRPRVDVVPERLVSNCVSNAGVRAGTSHGCMKSTTGAAWWGSTGLHGGGAACGAVFENGEDAQGQEDEDAEDYADEGCGERAEACGERGLTNRGANG